MVDHEYEGIYTKHPNVSLLLNQTPGADVLCSSGSILVESTNRCTSPVAPLNLATEEQSLMTSSDGILPPASVYEASQLPAMSRVVMVAGLDEAVTMLLNSRKFGRSGNSREADDDSGGGGGGLEGGGEVGCSEELMMFPESENGQQTEVNYLNFESGTSLHIADGIVHFTGNNVHDGDDAVRLHNSDRVVHSSDLGAATAALMIDSSKSGLDGFLKDVPVDKTQLMNSCLPSSQQVVHVVDLIQTPGPNVFRLVTNPDRSVSFVSLPTVQLSREQGSDDYEIDSGVQLVHVETIDVQGPPLPVMPLKPSMKLKKLPPGCPTWALALNDCERIGDSFRGWVETDVELDAVMTYFRQLTHSYWGTRQSPSQSKPSTRLMWKSQYVPFDGIPFINSGSRAVVMECQYGPRRQSNAKRFAIEMDTKKAFKQSCPARVYIKKVRKFPEFAVDSELDKKQLKIAMDQSFHSLREINLDKMGEDRFYIQLPTEAAHEFHSESLETAAEAMCPHHLHPKVSEKIREIVSNGEMRLYPIRNMLRRYVEKDLFSDSEAPPARHDLTYFPTVNDLQNNIHQAIRDIESGVLPFNAPTVDVEMNASCESPHSQPSDVADDEAIGSSEDRVAQRPYAQKVTVTLCARSGEGGEHVISKVETLMSDGRIVTSSSLPPELAHIISKVPQTDDTEQIDETNSVLLSDSVVSNDPTDRSSTNPFATHSHSDKFSPTRFHETIKSEIEADENDDVGSHFDLDDDNCDVVEEFCDTEPWRKEFVLRSKRILDDCDLSSNSINIKRRKLN